VRDDGLTVADGYTLNDPMIFPGEVFRSACPAAAAVTEHRRPRSGGAVSIDGLAPGRRTARLQADSRFSTAEPSSAPSQTPT
jgi:hypothetical protein